MKLNHMMINLKLYAYIINVFKTSPISLLFYEL